jgi:hypothetical protein
MHCLSATKRAPQHREQQYPTLRRMARDYLAIQGSSTPSERAFSGGGLTGTTLRNRLEVEIFEALQILKSAYRNGHTAAAEQAAHHLDALIASLDAAEAGEGVEGVIDDM